MNEDISKLNEIIANDARSNNIDLELINSLDEIKDNLDKLNKKLTSLLV